MKQSEKTFQILDTLDRKKISTQRQLADHSGISLGQVNYILKSLLEKGFVKIGNFRKNPRKISYAYLLTPKGIETKSKLAVSFMVSKLNEYDSLKAILAEKLTIVEKKGLKQIIFVGPGIVKQFMVSIINENAMNLTVVDHLETWEELKRVNPEYFDIALLFDDTSQGIKTIANSIGISQEKLNPLW